MQLYIISFLASIIIWFWIILKYDKFEREPFKSVLFVFITGGLISSLPAGFFNQLFARMINIHFQLSSLGNMSIKNSLLLFGFVGFNEEFLKAAATILLIRKMKAFNEPADALVYAMTVAFGFSAFENIEYTLNYGLVAFYLRQFNAVPLHIGLAAIWGIGIARAKFLHQGKYLITVLPFILIAALIHFTYNFTPKLIFHPILSLLLSCTIAFLLIRFAIRKLKHYSQDGPFSDKLYCRHCNTPNLLFARVCRNCGKKFQFEFYTFCTDCGAKVDKSASVCSKCSVELTNESSG